MNAEIKFRPLRADEIECRVGQAFPDSCTLLLYKDARVDQRLLDEVVGPYMWQRKHELIDGQLFCTVSIFSEHSIVRAGTTYGRNPNAPPRIEEVEVLPPALQEVP